ncbi:site-specific DNA-methyltransferase [Bernardetia sp. MNP-M8]|uniref:DNA-methyltransferase n=1 Tax=Bernardetia sp. MNP-M8 TaxID=3127470 RepID=UPI0030CE4E13
MPQLHNKSSHQLKEIEDNSIDALITDPPYGISYQKNDWDKSLPNKKVWKNSFKKMKFGSFGLVFSSVRLMHRLMVDLEDSGFLIKDVLFWSYLNGMPKSRNVGLSIDKELGVESKKVGEYKYVQGYKKEGAESYKTDKNHKLSPNSEIGKKYDGTGLGLKPAYEPIILIQKPIEEGLKVAQNVIKYGTGALNFEETRIPYQKNEGKVGHNPHEKGRVPANIIRTDAFEDGYDKFFLVPKVRQKKDDFNSHPTLKPVELMQHLVKLITFENQIVLDPFMGSGSTGVACKELNREFVGYELDKGYFKIAKKRIDESLKNK